MFMKKKKLFKQIMTYNCNFMNRSVAYPTHRRPQDFHYLFLDFPRCPLLSPFRKPLVRHRQNRCRKMNPSLDGPINTCISLGQVRYVPLKYR